MGHKNYFSIHTYLLPCSFVHIDLEPNLWGEYGYEITPTEHAADFSVLKTLIENENPLGRKIAGPDVTKRADEYFIEYVVIIIN